MTAMTISMMKCSLTDAPSAWIAAWASIPWPIVEEHANRLQMCIVKAARVKAEWPGQFKSWPLGGLSRMTRKCHVRFLGEGAAVTPPPYPT